MTGPPDRAALAPATNRPTARVRCRGSVNEWLSSASAQEPSSAAPSPCTARAAISMAMLVDRPQSTDAAVKTTNPVHSIRLAPNRSPSAPAVRISAASTRV